MHLVRPGMWIGKLNIKNTYYSVPIYEDNQSLWKFQYQIFLFKFTALTNGYTEWPGKFTKLMKPPLAFIRKVTATGLEPRTTYGWLEPRTKMVECSFKN